VKKHFILKLGAYESEGGGQSAKATMFVVLVIDGK